jgi:hypothetical protein
MQPARHIASPQNCPGVFNAADEAEICSRRRTTEGTMTLQMRAATAPGLLRIGVGAIAGVFHRGALVSLNASWVLLI